MSTNANFICYRGYEWTRTFQFVACNGLFDLEGYGIDFYVQGASSELVHLSLGNGITVNLLSATATVTLTQEQTTALDTAGLPVFAVTEVQGGECCDGVSGPLVFDTKTGPVAACQLVLTPPAGGPVPPYIIGNFLVV